MKKFIAVILSVLCVFSSLAVVASAGSFDEISNLISSAGEEDNMLYGITYQKETLSDVSMMYKPNPSMSISGPGYVTVTKDTPIAVDHDFICWKDKDGNLYYEGDKVYVDGEITLYAVWEAKKDNDPHALRVVKAALATFERMILKFLGIFKDIQDFDSSYKESSSLAEVTATAA